MYTKFGIINHGDEIVRGYRLNKKVGWLTNFFMLALLALIVTSIFAR